MLPKVLMTRFLKHRYPTPERPPVLCTQPGEQIRSVLLSTYIEDPPPKKKVAASTLFHLDRKKRVFFVYLFAAGVVFFGLTFTWWECCGLSFFLHKPTELALSFLFSFCVCFCL